MGSLVSAVTGVIGVRVTGVKVNGVIVVRFTGVKVTKGHWGQGY